MEDETSGQSAAVLNVSAQEVARIDEATRTFLHQRLSEAGHVPDNTEAALAAAPARMAQIPQPLENRNRISAAFATDRDGLSRSASNAAAHSGH